MNQKNVLLFAALVAMLAACQPKPVVPEPTASAVAASAVQAQPQPAVLRGDILELSLNLPECQTKHCPEMTVYHLHSSYPQIDQSIDQAITQHLQQILQPMAALQSSEKNQPPVSSEKSVAQLDQDKASAQSMQPTQTDLAVTLQPSVQQFLAIDRELKSLGSSQQINLLIKPSILKEQGPLVTVLLNSSHYFGGAHGSSSQLLYNFDLKTQRQVQLADIVHKNQMAQLQQVAHAVFVQWLKDSQQTSNLADYEQVWPFKLTANFYLSDQGLVLQYGEYEIAPYAAGLPRLEIPYSDLQGIVKAQYLPEKMQSQSGKAKQQNQ